MATAQSKHTWTANEDSYVRAAYNAGRPYLDIAKALRLSVTTVRSRCYNLGLKEADLRDQMPRVHREVCGYCATRADAPIEFGCAKCRPLRREIAA